MCCGTMSKSCGKLQGLVVPVLRNVENMNYAEIEKGLNELGEKVGITFGKCYISVAIG